MIGYLLLNNWDARYCDCIVDPRCVGRARQFPGYPYEGDAESLTFRFSTFPSLIWNTQVSGCPGSSVDAVAFCTVYLSGHNNPTIPVIRNRSLAGLSPYRPHYDDEYITSASESDDEYYSCQSHRTEYYTCNSGAWNAPSLRWCIEYISLWVRVGSD